MQHIEAGWDQLIRVAASIEGDWLSAVLALTRFGSAARADPIHQAGSALGKLLRSLFLCDYLSNEGFRREVLRILNRGEFVHTLQRAIHSGSIAASRGRRREELVAISGSLSLLANIVMAWMTHSEFNRCWTPGRKLAFVGSSPRCCATLRRSIFRISIFGA